MSEAVKTEHPRIVHILGVCGEEPLIDALRVSVRHVVTLHQRGEPIVEIAEALGISEAQVFHALSYFFDHRDEIMASIAGAPRSRMPLQASPATRFVPRPTRH